MRYVIANLIVLGCFVVLMCYAYGMVYGHNHKPAQEVSLWIRDKAAEFRQRQVAALAAVYNIDAANMESDIFGGDK